MKSYKSEEKSYLEADRPAPAPSGEAEVNRYIEFRQFLVDKVMPFLPTSGPSPLRAYDELFPEAKEAT